MAYEWYRWSPQLYQPSQPSFFTLLSFPSDPPGWLVCCCATSAHSLQEMTNRVKDNRQPSEAAIAMEKGLTFAIREGGRTVGAGQVTEIIK